MFYEPCMLGWSAGICCFWLDDVLDDALIRSSCRRFTLHEANIKGSECEMCSAYLLSEDFADRCRGSQVFLLRRGVWYFMGMAMLTNNPLGDDESDLSGNFSFQTFHLITFTRSHQTNRINLKIQREFNTCTLDQRNDAPFVIILLPNLWKFIQLPSIRISMQNIWIHQKLLHALTPRNASYFGSNDDNCWQYQSNVNYFCELFDLFVKLICRNVKMADVGKKSNHIQFVHVSCWTRTYPQCIMYVLYRTGEIKLEIAYVFLFYSFSALIRVFPNDHDEWKCIIWPR